MPEMAGTRKSKMSQLWKKKELMIMMMMSNVNNTFSNSSVHSQMNFFQYHNLSALIHLSSFFFLLSSSSHHLLLTLRILLITGHQNSNSTHLSQNTPYTCKMLMHLMCLFLHKEPLNSIYNFDVILKKKSI